MARAIKTGLDYFPLDVNFFYDPKVQLIESEFGHRGGYIVLRLLTMIYREGYHYQWNADECLLFVKNMGVAGVSDKLVQMVVYRLVDRGFFEKSLYDSFGVLTSAAIQRQYRTIVRMGRLKRPLIDERYCLIEEEEETVWSDKGVKCSIDSVESTQTKLNQTKLKETPSSSEKGGDCSERSPLGEGRDVYFLSLDSVSVPDDGVKRNLEGLLRSFREFRIAGNEAKRLLELSNYGETGEHTRIWKLFAEIRQSNGLIRFPYRFLVARLAK